MTIVAKVGSALQRVFGDLAEHAAQATRLIVRRRKFSAVSLAQTFVLGFLQKPDATDDDLARLALSCGAEVSPQAIEGLQRRNWAFV